MQEAVFTCRSLLDICSIISDGTHHTPKYIDSGNLGVHFISVKDVREWEVNFENTKFISEEEHQVLAKRCSPKANDILLTKIGTIGKAALVPLDAPIFDIFVSVALLRVREDRALPTFITYFLNSDTARMQFNRVVKGVGVPDLHLEDIAEIKIALPGIAKQHELVAAMDKARSQRRQKLAESDNLLASLDDYLLNTIGLDRPAEDNRKVFAMRVQDIRLQGRLNSEYFHPERILALRAMTTAAKTINCQRLQDIATFERSPIKTPEENYLGLAHVHSHTGELTNVNDTATGNCFTFQQGDVLFARLRPYLNKVYCAEIDGCCSPEFHVLRIGDTNLILPDYLAVILRSRLILAQTIHMMTGNTHPRLANEDVINLVIPIPDLEVQRKIAVELKSRREEARRLRAEAEIGWQDAKKWFEEQLLGSVPL